MQTAQWSTVQYFRFVSLILKTMDLLFCDSDGIIELRELKRPFRRLNKYTVLVHPCDKPKPSLLMSYLDLSLPDRRD